MTNSVNTYIVYEAPEGMVIVDQHSAHERVLYESVLAQLTGGTPRAAPAASAYAGAHRRRAGRGGAPREPFATCSRPTRSGAARSCSTRYRPRTRGSTAGACFREPLADLARGRFGAWANPLERFAATFACRAAIKAGNRSTSARCGSCSSGCLLRNWPPTMCTGARRSCSCPARSWSGGRSALECRSGGPDGGRQDGGRARARGHWPLEIISADSRQVYRRLDIGTAKPTRKERARVPHHGLDLVEPGARYSAGHFARDAEGWLADIRGRSRMPVVVGGTGLYVRALAEGLFREPPLDTARRRSLDAFTARLEPLELLRWAGRLDPGFRGGGRQRAARAVEVALLTGHPLSHWQEVARARGALDPWYIVLTVPRPVLHQRIARRAAEMMQRGLIEEVASVLAEGHAAAGPGLDGDRRSRGRRLPPRAAAARGGRGRHCRQHATVREAAANLVSAPARRRGADPRRDAASGAPRGRDRGGLGEGRHMKIGISCGLPDQSR